MGGEEKQKSNESDYKLYKSEFVMSLPICSQSQLNIDVYFEYTQTVKRKSMLSTIYASVSALYRDTIIRVHCITMTLSLSLIFTLVMYCMHRVANCLLYDVYTIPSSSTRKSISVVFMWV